MLGNKEIMAKNILHYMKIKNKTRTEMCEILNVPYTTFTGWIKAQKYPRIDKIELMANYFGIAKSELIEERKIEETIQGVKIPVLGRVAAGIPYEAIENIVEWEEIPAHWQGDYKGLVVKGNSMSPQILDGDTLIVKLQNTAESGDIVIALVNGEDATVKRLLKHEHGITLQPFNPEYEPMYFSKESQETIPVIIWGKVVEIRRKL